MNKAFRVSKTLKTTVDEVLSKLTEKSQAELNKLVEKVGADKTLNDAWNRMSYALADELEKAYVGQAPPKPAAADGGPQKKAS